MLVNCDLRKWDGRQGYTFTAELLGHDDHGTWLGIPAGTAFVGPKYPGVWHHPFVTCVPPKAWWLATFYGPGNPLDLQVYVDMTTVAEWPTESTFTCVDLDLDVARYQDARIELLDEDEFDAHRIEMSYPVEIVEGARASAAHALAAVEQRVEPFGEVGLAWLERLG